MIKTNNKSISSVYDETTSIGKIMKGTLIVYEHWKRLIASGVPPITLQKCKNANLIDYKICGNSKQQNKNLLPQTYYANKNVTIMGMTFKTNDDGSITINGTASINYSGFMLININAPIRFEAGTYTLSGNPTVARLWFREVGSGTNLISVYNGSTATITLTKPSNMYCYMSVNSGNTINNVTIYPQIEKGSTATEWVSQVVLPTNPIEIESVGEKTKNLINISNDFTFTRNTPLGDLDLEAGTYTLSIGDYSTTGETETSNLRLQFEDNTYQMYSFGTNRKTRTITTTKRTVGYYLYAYSDYTTSAGITVNVKNFMLEKGSNATEYEPYGKYKIPIISRGKNLIDVSTERETGSTSTVLEQDKYYLIAEMRDTASNNSPGGSGWAQGWVQFEHVFKTFETGKTYAISYDIEYLEKPDNVSFPITHNLLCGNQNNFVDIDELNKKYKVQGLYTKSETGTMAITCNSSRIKISNLQIEEGTVSTDFEPYVEPITTNIYLNEPLRKIDDYYDYIDFKQGKVIRQIYNEFLDTVTTKSLNTTTYTVFLTDISKKPLVTNEGSVTSSKGWCISNKFQLSRQYYSVLSRYPNLIQTYLTTSGANRVAYTFDDTTITTVEQAQEKIGNGFEVSYVLDTPREELIELPNILLNKGTNIIEVDTSVLPSNMDVVYYGKGKLEILNQTDNIVLNKILGTNTETELDITDTEINEILDEIIGG